MLSFEQKMMALKAIASSGDVWVQMRAPGDWYCSVRGVEIGNGRTLTSPTSRSATPEEAVADAWENYTVLNDDQYLVLGAMTEARRCVRWNGFMWDEHKETA